MNCLVTVVLTVCVLHAVEGRSFLDKRIFRVKRDTSPDFKLSLQDSISKVHTRERRSARKSFVFLDNRSDRTVQLYYRNINTDIKKKFSSPRKPGKTIDINSYETHEWTATDVRTGKPLLICGEEKYVPKANTKASKATCIIKSPGQDNTDIREKFVEILIVVDKAAQKLHASATEVERYVKIIVNLASKIFQHETLTERGLTVRLIPSKIILLQYDLKFTYSSEEYNLYHACKHMNQIGNKGRKRFDHKLYLTRNEFGAGGFARSYGMCSQYSSCSIIHDKGFSSAFVVAHEIAHSFGATHDDFSPHSRDVMNDVILANFENYKWSLRSQHALLANIRKYHCLNDKHEEIKVNYPGKYYTMEQQCHLENDETYSLYPPSKKNPCKQLRCRLPKWPSFWRPMGRPLDGTECAKDKWCIAGQCQYK